MHGFANSGQKMLKIMGGKKNSRWAVRSRKGKKRFGIARTHQRVVGESSSKATRRELPVKPHTNEYHTYYDVKPPANEYNTYNQDGQYEQPAVYDIQYDQPDTYKSLYHLQQPGSAEYNNQYEEPNVYNNQYDEPNVYNSQYDQPLY